jgi:hypothetical protein
MFWKQKSSPVEDCAHALYEALAKAITQNGRIRVEDLISAAAAIVGEASIGAAGDFNPRKHDFTPGSRVLSTKANELFCGDKDFNEAPADSVVGILSNKLIKCGFTKADFPELKNVFTYFVANIGKGEEWGKVPLSIPKDNHPFIMPLRVSYETRPMVDKIFVPLGDNQQQKLQAAALALAETLCKTRDVLNRRIAITLALETVNGMSKTASMTDAAMEKLKAEPKP